MAKALLKYQPHGRPWSEIEAALSLQVDYDNNSPATVSGYAALWSWSRTRVSNFLERMGACIEYETATTRRQNQRGRVKRQIKKQIESRSETDTRQIRLIDSKQLEQQKNRSRTEKEQIESRSKSTTLDPIYDPDPKPPKPPKGGVAYTRDFLTFWDAYPRKVGKDAAWRAWRSRKGDRPPIDAILAAVEMHRESDQWKRDGGKFIPYPATWLNQGRWDDEIFSPTPAAEGHRGANLITRGRHA